MHVGIDVFEEKTVCRSCGMVLDTKGIHAASCTAGGDRGFRHDKVRNLLFRFCGRGHLRPELEKAGILDEEGVFVDLGRPADVLIDGRMGSNRGTERVALDVKVINALGANHFDELLQGSQTAAANYREFACEHQQTRSRCAEKGLRYEPVRIFTMSKID